MIYSFMWFSGKSQFSGFCEQIQIVEITFFRWNNNLIQWPVTCWRSVFILPGTTVYIVTERKYFSKPPSKEQRQGKEEFIIDYWKCLILSFLTKHWWQCTEIFSKRWRTSFILWIWIIWKIFSCFWNHWTGKPVTALELYPMKINVM